MSRVTQSLARESLSRSQLNREEVSSGTATYATYSDLPVSGNDGDYAVLTSYTPPVTVRYDENNGWVPPGLYGGPELTSSFDFNARNLELDDGDPVPSWGGLSQAVGSAQPTYRATDGPGGGPAVEFDGGDYLSTTNSTALGGARYVNTVAVCDLDSIANHAFFGYGPGSSTPLLQLTVNNDLQFRNRTVSTDAVGVGVMSSSGPPTDEWVTIACQTDYTGNVSKGLIGSVDGVEANVPALDVQAGEVSQNLATTGTVENAASNVAVGANQAGGTQLNGHLALLTVYRTTAKLTGVQLEALGVLAWLRAVG